MMHGQKNIKINIILFYTLVYRCKLHCWLTPKVDILVLYGRMFIISKLTGHENFKHVPPSPYHQPKLALYSPVASIRTSCTLDLCNMST